MRQRVRLRHQAGVDALEQAGGAAALGARLGEADEADAVAQRLRLRDVGGDDVADAGDRRGIEIDPRPEGQRRQDRELVRGVDAVDVEARIGLGIAQPLRLAEHVGEIAALGLHRGQDIIAGAVEDAVDAPDRVGRRALAQPLDHRDAARDRGLIFERDARRLGLARQTDAVMRDHRLVGGDEVALRRDRAARQRQRGAVGAADQLDDDVDIVARREFGRVVYPGEARQVDAAVARPVACRDRDDLDRAAGAALDDLAVGVEQLDDAAAHRAQPRQRDPQCLRHQKKPPVVQRHALARREGEGKRLTLSRQRERLKQSDQRHFTWPRSIERPSSAPPPAPSSVPSVPPPSSAPAAPPPIAPITVPVVPSLRLQ